MAKGIFPNILKVNEILGKAFRKDMKQRNVNYTVHIRPKGLHKYEVEIDI